MMAGASLHLMGLGRVEPATLTKVAKPEGAMLVYPAT